MQLDPERGHQHQAGEESGQAPDRTRVLRLAGEIEDTYLPILHASLPNRSVMNGRAWPSGAFTAWKV